MTTTATVASDKQQCGQLLHALFDSPPELVEIRPIETWTENGKKKSRVITSGHRWMDAADIVEQFDDLTTFAEKHSANMFFGVNGRMEEGQSTEATVDRIRVLWADIDHITPDAALFTIRNAELPEPSITINSGNGVHLYWLLSPAIEINCDEDRQRVKDVLKRLYRAIGADAVQDLARLLRLPGFPNRKNARNGTEPVPCTIHAMDHRRLYTFDQFAEYLPEDTTNTTTDATEIPPALQAAVRELEKPTDDRSKRDHSVCCRLIEAHIQPDEAESILQQHSKFANRNGTYFKATWAAAAKAVRDHSDDATENEPRRRSIMVRMNDVDSREVEWLWPGRFALGKVGLIGGHPGLGKSFVTLDIAARVSAGMAWPDDRHTKADPGNVIIMSGEDDPHDTIRPRLDSAGANVNRIWLLQGVQVFDPESNKPEERGLCLERDIGTIERAAEDIGGVKLIVIDPISAYMTKTDSHKNTEVRAVLRPLSELAMRQRAAIICVTHLNKGSTNDPIARFTGSVAYIAAARSGWIVVKDKLDEHRRLFLNAKMNCGPEVTGLAYTIRDDGNGPVIAWESAPLSMSATDAMAPAEDDQEKTAVASACHWLREALQDEPLESKHVKRMAIENGFSLRTIRRAQEEAGVVVTRQGFGKAGRWIWRLTA